MRKLVFASLSLAIGLFNLNHEMNPPTINVLAQLEELRNNYKNHPAQVISALQSSTLRCSPLSNDKRSKEIVARLFVDAVIHGIEIAENNKLTSVKATDRQKDIETEKSNYSMKVLSKITVEISSWKQTEKDEVERLLLALNNDRDYVTKCAMSAANQSLTKLAL
jgi:uncharacterized protein YcbK (DUF882 family)